MRVFLWRRRKGSGDEIVQVARRRAALSGSRDEGAGALDEFAGAAKRASCAPALLGLARRPNWGCVAMGAER
eukprot:5564499-Pyramimonas_sp.AAC.2